MNDAEAAAYVARVLPELTPAQSQFGRSVWRFETSYSAGWVALARKMGAPEPEVFSRVNNWGAITAIDPAKGGTRPAFFMRDRWWRIYETPEEGLRDAAAQLFKANVRAALGKGDGSAAVHAMASNKYFIEPGISVSIQERSYKSNIAKNYDDILRSTGEPKLLTFGASTGTGLLEAVTGALFVGGLLALIYTFGSGTEGKGDQQS